MIYIIQLSGETNGVYFTICLIKLQKGHILLSLEYTQIIFFFFFFLK